MSLQKHAIADPKTRAAIAKREPFATYGEMSGEIPPKGYGYGQGWLGADGAEAWQRDRYEADYIVWSFNTPIAWHTEARGWVVVSRNFSQRSSKHQSQARWGVSESDDKRVESVLNDYGLSDAQWALLQHIKATGGSFIENRQSRTAEILIQKDLARNNFPGQLYATELGKKAVG